MSSEGVTLIMRVALVIFLIVVASVFRALVGPGRRRGRIMLAGTLGGTSCGVLLAYPISQWLKTDAAVICARLGCRSAGKWPGYSQGGFPTRGRK